MAKVILDMSISLDGFIAGPHNEDGGLHNWYFAPSNGASSNSDHVITESIRTLGAIVMGRRTYEVGDQQDGFVDNPYRATHFVLTHQAPDKVAKGATKFIFVTDGIASALAQAKVAAGDKDIAVGGGANTAQQFLKAGLLDEIQLHVVPVLLSKGVRLFDDIGAQQIDMEQMNVIESPDVTHLRFRILK